MHLSGDCRARSVGIRSIDGAAASAADNTHVSTSGTDAGVDAAVDVGRIQSVNICISGQRLEYNILNSAFT